MDLQPEFSLALPPRPVPLTLRLGLLFGGVAQFGTRGNYVGFCDQFSNEDHDCNKEP